jgi:hypothetical protein
MNKQSDFENDLATLQDSVTAEVGDVLQALQQKRSAVQTRTAKKEELQVPLTTLAPSELDQLAPPAAAPTPRRYRSVSRSRLVPAVEREEPLENVTTRLRHRTNELLTEAALRQRLKKESPATRQDIVEAALGDWFRKHGYATGRNEDVDF